MKNYEYEVTCPTCNDTKTHDENPLEEDVVFTCGGCGDELCPSECIVEITVKVQKSS